MVRSYKKNDRMLILWPLALLISDFVALSASMMIAYQVRFYSSLTDIIPVIYGIPPFSNYIMSSIVGALFWVVIVAVRGTYKIRYEPNLIHDIFNVLFSFYIGFALTFAILFFYRDFFYSRVVAIMTLVIGSLLLILVRLLFSIIRKAVFSDSPLHRALIIGPHQSVITDRLQQTHSGLTPAVSVDDDKANDIIEIVNQNHIDTVIFAYGFDQYSRVREIIDTLGGKRLHFLYIPEPKTMVTSKLATISLAGLAMLRLREDPLSGWNGLIKRTFDIVVSFSLLIFFLPIIFILFLLVSSTSRGPVIFKQIRIGLDGRKFNILKFRTMKVDAEKGSGPVWASKSDSRVTPVGGFLRRWSLDELLQLWNVLRGEMSLVGPRPERPSFVDQFSEQVPRYAERHRVRCGMSGWAQVNGMRGQSSIEERTRLDIFYVENWTIGLDLWILARTFLAVLNGNGAY
jgi:exopolysaccharide biosynthesis polyprenyl glycosylphosphotransferase